MPVRYKPKFDRLFYIPISIALVLSLGATALCAVYYAPFGLAVMILCDLLVLYLLISAFVGYVELREETLFIKFGFFLKKEIAYNSIRRVEKCRKIYSESIVSLKSSLEHIDIRYNKYDVVSVSVVDNDALIEKIEKRRAER